MSDTNIEIKNLIFGKGLKQWQVAYAMGMQDSNFSKLLRTDLSLENKEKILKAINFLTVKGE